HLAPHKIVQIIHRVQANARSGQIAPNNVAAEVITQVQSAVTTELSPVLNATGVIIHTNLGRAPLSQAARDSLIAAAGYVDLELDLTHGQRFKRAAGANPAVVAT